MKIYTWLIAIAYFLTLAILNETNTQESTSKMLCNMWQLKTYSVKGKKYAPNKKEKEDYILFKENRTFTSKSEGKEENGKYILNTNGAYALLIDKKGDTIKAYINSISKKFLVLKYAINEMRDVEVHYNTSTLSIN